MTASGCSARWRIFFDAYPDRRVVDVLDIRRRTSTTYRQR